MVNITFVLSNTCYVSYCNLKLLPLKAIIETIRNRLVKSHDQRWQLEAMALHTFAYQRNQDTKIM